MKQRIGRLAAVMEPALERVWEQGLAVGPGQAACRPFAALQVPGQRRVLA